VPTFVAPKAQKAKEKAAGGPPGRGGLRSKRREEPSQRTIEAEEEGSDASVMSVVSSASERMSTRMSTRKRRSETPTGETPAKCFVTRGSEDEDEDDDVLNSRVAPGKTRAKSALAKSLNLVGTMSTLETSHIGDYLNRCTDVVEKVADKSGKLQGPYVRKLREAALTVRAASEELLKRTCLDENVARLERENAELRSQLSSVAARMEELTGELKALRQEGLRSPGAGHKNKKKKKAKSPTSAPGVTAATAPMVAAPMVPATAPRAPVMAVPQRTVAATLPQGSMGMVPEDQLVRIIGELLDARLAKLLPASCQTQAGPSGSTAELPEALPYATQVSVPSPAAAETWATVTSRNARRKAATKLQPKLVAPPPQAKSKKKKGPGAPKPPSTAAVTVTVPKECQTTYAAVMGVIKERITPIDCGGQPIRIRSAITGGLILEVPGADGAAKADVLAAKIREAVSELEGVRVSRPTKCGEVRVMDLHEAITPEEVAVAVATAGGCSVGDVRTGELRRSKSGMHSSWVRCPLAAVRKLETAKRIAVGWILARVEILAKRPMRCFRCLEPGHVGSKCPGDKDRSNCCFICGQDGHKAKECTAAAPKCPVCVDHEVPSDHRLGTKKCVPNKGKRRSKKAPPISEAPAVRAEVPPEGPPVVAMEA
jgi:hypothetical protein